MRVLYVASNRDKAPALQLEQEITELQQRAPGVTGDPIRFTFLPNLCVEQLPIEIAKTTPDILHISVHGESEKLCLANRNKDAVFLTAEKLKAFLNIKCPPRLVYLNACNSQELARSLTGTIEMAIGTTAPITNSTAIESAVLFYHRLSLGATVQNAFEAGKAMMETLQQDKVSSILHCRKDINPLKERLHSVPRIVARFSESDCSGDKYGNFDIELGVSGCPGNTIQVVFFTDNETFYEDCNPNDEVRMASKLCFVVRKTPVNSMIWSNWSQQIWGDYRIFACGNTASGELFAVVSTVCEAIEEHFSSWYEGQQESSIPASVRTAISQMRRNDGGDDEEYFKAFRPRKPRPGVVQSGKSRGLNAKSRREMAAPTR